MHRLTDKNPETMTATCAVCGPVNMHFRKAKGEYVCRVKWRENDRNQKRGSRMSGVSHELQAQLLESQNNRCAICQEEFTKTPHLDHCHTTGKIRGFLCHSCNVGIGHFRDDPVRLAAAIAYLS